MIAYIRAGGKSNARTTFPVPTYSCFYHPPRRNPDDFCSSRRTLLELWKELPLTFSFLFSFRMTTRFDEDDSSEVARASLLYYSQNVNVGRAVIAYKALFSSNCAGKYGKNGPQIGGRRLRAGFAWIKHGSNAPSIKWCYAMCDRPPQPNAAASDPRARDRRSGSVL